MDTGRCGSFGDWNHRLIPSAPSGSIFHDKSIQNSDSSHTSPGLASWVRSTRRPSLSAATRNTGWRKPSQEEAWVS